MGFSRQETSGWPCHPPEDLPDHGSNLCLLCLLNWHAGSLPLVPPGKPWGLSGNTEEGGLFLTQVLKPNNHHEGLCVQRLCFLLEDFASGVTRQFWAQWCHSRPCKLTDLLFSMFQVQAPHDIWLRRLLAASRGGSLAGQDSLVMPPYHPQTVFRLGVKLGMVPREADIWYQEKDSWKGECRQVTHSEAPWRSASSQFFLRLLFILPLNRLEQERIWRKDVSGTLKVLIPDQMGKCQNVIIISNIYNIWLYVRYYSKHLTWMLLTPSLIE